MPAAPGWGMTRFRAIPPAIDLWHNSVGMRRYLLAFALGGSALLAQPPAAPPSSDFHAPPNWFQWKKFATVQPRTFAFSSRPAQPVCSVPLLAAPVDPNVDLKMPVLKEPAGNIDNMPIAKGLPPCPSRESQPEVLVVPSER